ncbi:CDP-diacylglycerol--glycerol-3-phosphate 3-phosphatidyltransferase [Streptomyces sp. AD681]|uniref:CDP-diacylglycerol--glycerol-3-phosphate 3-phosphatidyltransferase n=1 Tax=Streptomyces sp. AD681 TaxID=3019069 RepID=UPI0022F19D4E|nr:CDP-diacylglycerol--glycerol-3-phosphate 3-phosphatidyltransferase [Streptomyces sp. AD681]MDA5146580.1 CDP-diacylglycerol--glycerol-3-phosphate 3-phosphatidyltransferase [Streptomyces sp. AD681]
MTGVPASAAGGSSSARRTGPRGTSGAAQEPVGRTNPGSAVERVAAERAATDRGTTDQGTTDRGSAERGSTEGGAAGRGGKIAAAAVNQASVWNVANLLTMLRLLLVPAFVALMLGNGGYDPAWRSFAWAAFAIAMITDLFDGHLARTYNLVTDFGKIADPIADKAIMGAALICLSALGDLPWWVTAVILGRELGITVLRFVVIRYGVIPASRGGKLKTLTQGIAVGMYVLALTGPLATLRFWVMAAAVVLTVATGLDYVKQAIVLRRRGIAERRAALKETEA